MYNERTKNRRGYSFVNAKAELAKRLVAVVSGNEPVTGEVINTILKDYTIQKESEEEKRDLQKKNLAISGSETY